jgi:hypothetical protein
MAPDDVMFLLVQLGHMTVGAALFFSVVALCMLSLTHRAIDLVVCALRKTCGAVVMFVDGFVDGFRAGYADEPHPPRAVMPKAEHHYDPHVPAKPKR